MERTSALALMVRIQDAYDPQRKWPTPTVNAYLDAFAEMDEATVGTFVLKRIKAGGDPPTPAEIAAATRLDRPYEPRPKGCERCDGHGFQEITDDEQRTWVKACNCSAGNARRETVANIAERNDQELRRAGVRT